MKHKCWACDLEFPDDDSFDLHLLRKHGAFEVADLLREMMESHDFKPVQSFSPNKATEIHEFKRDLGSGGQKVRITVEDMG